ncbi:MULTISPECIES: amidohydrolase family protein [Caulobacter]|jgi:imidazolonepropionase-like amidohydrolase|uniref:Pro-Hyp dipeptidase n=1 Tax=Caulobacter vibrioides OR37 TaxID=1292034 RepID=R0E6Z6_CAUVI|nr:MULTISPECIES: amidohydrolase family protein [Caulobacter]ENZ81278.1 Pro-Hyp dipeptidase [Caulobacter vibrioides OR37]MBQ1560021.1 amidohydrolase family protein [Caulobacter sp.]
MRKGIVASALVLGLALGSAASAAQVEAVSASRLLDVASGKYVDNPLVIVTDGRITSIGKKGDAVPAGAKVVDLPGATLLPGLIDMHTHISALAEIGGYNSLQYSDRFWSVVQTANAKKTLNAGFTTIRNVGSDAFDDVGLREAIDAGYVVGPRIVTATYAIGATGGHCDSTFFPPSMDQKGPYNIDSPDEARKAVRTLKKYGAQVIKICATGGVFSHGDEPGQQQLTLDEMKAVADEAHMAGLRVAAHAHGAAGIKDAIRAGIDTIEHASLVDDEGIKLAIQHGTYFSMDIYNTDYTQAEGKKNGVLEDNLRKDRDIGEIQRQNFKKALKAGVKMVFGTDAGVYPHGDNAKQFAVMVRYGATPLQAIQSATITAAEALGRPKDVGQVAVGLYGDIIAVGGDPLADVTLLEHPVFVMKGGQVVRQP